MDSFRRVGLKDAFVSAAAVDSRAKRSVSGRDLVGGFAVADGSADFRRPVIVVQSDALNRVEFHNRVRPANQQSEVGLAQKSSD